MQVAVKTDVPAGREAGCVRTTAQLPGQPGSTPAVAARCTTSTAPSRAPGTAPGAVPSVQHTAQHSTAHSTRHAPIGPAPMMATLCPGATPALRQAWMPTAQGQAGVKPAGSVAEAARPRSPHAPPHPTHRATTGPPLPPAQIHAHPNLRIGKCVAHPQASPRHPAGHATPDSGSHMAPCSKLRTSGSL